jgi:non-specific protein-tyrosine kinase
MKKATKLFGYLRKETKEIERNPISVKKVRDFVTRYSRDDDFSFAGPYEKEAARSSTALAFSSASEEQASAQTKRTRGRGSALSFAGRTSAEPAAEDREEGDAPGSLASGHEFPIIEFPPPKHRTGKGGAAYRSDATNRFRRVSAETAREGEDVAGDPDTAGELPVIEPLADVAEPPAEGAAEPNAAFGVSENKFSFATGRGKEFRIVDDEVLVTEEPASTSAAVSEPVRASTEALVALELSGAAQAKPELNRHALHTQGERSDSTAPPSEQGATLARPARQPVRFSVQTAIPRRRGKIKAVRLQDRKGPTPQATVGGELAREEKTETAALAPRAPQPERALLNDAADRAPFAFAKLTDLDPRLVSFLAPGSFEAEQYRLLRSLVERLRRKKGRTCVVAVTSPAAGDGKTTTAINLAGAFAQAADARVLLVDADFRHPSVHDRLGAVPATAHGFAEAVMRPQVKLRDAIVWCAALNLSVLTAGETTLTSPEVLKSPRIGVLLEEARQHFDYILVDTPPLAPFPDCRFIEKWVDGFFVVIAAHKTSRKLVQEALSVVDEKKILGLVFNGDDPPLSGYDKYYGHYPYNAARGS